jgi:hypothetical protein
LDREKGKQYLPQMVIAYSKFDPSRAEEYLEVLPEVSVPAGLDAQTLEALPTKAASRIDNLADSM